MEEIHKKTMKNTHALQVPNTANKNTNYPRVINAKNAVHTGRNTTPK
jgi:hypothetical protein